MADRTLIEQILHEVDRQPDPVTAGQIASAAALLYWATWPYQPGYSSGKTPAEVRQMAIKLAAMCVKLAQEMEL